MMWLTLLPVLLLIRGSESSWLPVREMSPAMPLAAMPDTELTQLSANIRELFENAGLSCPHRARATLTVGLMSPRIFVSPFPVHQMVFKSTPALPVRVQDAVTSLIRDVVLENFRDERIPELSTMMGGLDDLDSEFSYLLEEALPVAGRGLTGSGLVRRMRTVIEMLKSVSCDEMIQPEDLREFMTKAEAVLEQPKLGEERFTSIKQWIQDEAVATRISQNAVRAVGMILSDIRSYMYKMAAVPYTELPIGVFIRAIVKSSRPVSFEHGVEREYSHPYLDSVFMSNSPVISSPYRNYRESVISSPYRESIISSPYSEIREAAMSSPYWKPTVTPRFPASSDPCYEQKLAAYNMALVKVFTHMNIKAVRTLPLWSTLDINIKKPVYEIMDAGLYESMVQHDLMTSKAVRQTLRAASRLHRTLEYLERSSALSEQTIIRAVNDLMRTFSTKLTCTLEPSVLMPLLTTSYNTMQTWYSEQVGEFLRSKITGVDEEILKELIPQLTTRVSLFKPSFEAMFRDFEAKTFTGKPLTAILSLLKTMETSSPLNPYLGYKPVPMVSAALRIYGVNCDDVITRVPLPQLRLVVEKLISEVESQVPDMCRSDVVVRLTPGLIRAMIANKYEMTEHMVMSLLGRTIPPSKMTSRLEMLDTVRRYMRHQLHAVLHGLPHIRGVHVPEMMYSEGMESMPVAEVLHRIIGKLSRVYTVKPCEMEVSSAEWPAYITRILEHLKYHQESAALNDLLSVFTDVTKERVHEIMRSSWSTLFDDVTSAIRPLADNMDYKIIRQMYIQNLISGIHQAYRPGPLATMAGPVIPEAVEMFANPMYKRITSRYSKALTPLLEGVTAEIVGSEMIEKLVDDVIRSVLNRGSSYWMRSGQSFYYPEEKMDTLLEILEGVGMETAPSDVIYNTFSKIVRQIEETGSAECRLPIKAKFVSALVRLQLEKMFNPTFPIYPAHPFVQLLAPVLQGFNPRHPLPLEKVMMIVETILPHIHTSIMGAMRDQAIFKGMESIEDILYDVLAEVQPGEMTTDRYATILPRLTALLQEEAMCEGVNPEKAVHEIMSVIARMKESPAFSRRRLSLFLKPVLPEDLVLEEVLESLVKVALPLLNTHFSDLVTMSRDVFSERGRLTPFYSQIFSFPLSLNVSPVRRLYDSPIYRMILDEVKTELIARLLPISNLPAEYLNHRMTEAYLSTLLDLGLVH